MQAYDNLYTALALDHKTLSVRDRELVWLAILVACDEALATHHIARFYDGGGTDAEFKAVLRLTASIKGTTAYSFVQNHWMPHLPSMDIVAAYRDAVEHAGDEDGDGGQCEASGAGVFGRSSSALWRHAARAAGAGRRDDR